MRLRVRMKSQADGQCPWSMTGQRRALPFRYVIDSDELSLHDKGRWVADESSRYSACFHPSCIHVWDGHLGTCLYELTLERGPGRTLRITSAFVLDDRELYHRCLVDQDESARLAKILDALFRRRD